MLTIVDIFNMCFEYWYHDNYCLHMLCEYCPKGSVCAMQLFAFHDLLKDGEYH